METKKFSYTFWISLIFSFPPEFYMIFDTFHVHFGFSRFFFDFPGFHMSSYTFWISLIFYIFSEFIMIFIYILDFHDIQIYFGIFLDFSEFQTISIWILSFPRCFEFYWIPDDFHIRQSQFIRESRTKNPRQRQLVHESRTKNSTWLYIFWINLYFKKRFSNNIFKIPNTPSPRQLEFSDERENPTKIKNPKNNIAKHNFIFENPRKTIAHVIIFWKSP